MTLLLTAALLIGSLSSDASATEPSAVDASSVEETSPAGAWLRLAECESTSRWHINTGNGYFGGLQIDMTFWRRYGGPEFAARPDLATPAQQIIVAERGLAVQGWGAWPVCSRLIGVR